MGHEDLVTVARRLYVQPMLESVRGEADQLRVACVVHGIARMLGDGMEPRSVIDLLRIAPVTPQDQGGAQTTQLVSVLLKHITALVVRRVSRQPKEAQDAAAKDLLHAIAIATCDYVRERYNKSLMLQPGYAIRAEDVRMYQTNNGH